MPVQDVWALVAEANVSPIPVCTGTTTTTTPIDLCMIPVDPGGTLVAEVLIVARRTDTGASKVWKVVISLKRVGSGNASIEGNQGAATPIVSAGDTTPMSAVAIALAASGGSAGVRCTGLAGVTIQWAVQIMGLLLTQ